MSKKRSLRMLLTAQNSEEKDFQMNANELYPIVNPARILGKYGLIVLVTSFGILAILGAYSVATPLLRRNKTDQSAILVENRVADIPLNTMFFLCGKCLQAAK